MGTWKALFAEHNVLTWASAIAFQVLIALAPLTILVLGVLGASGEQSVWKKQLAPGIEKRLPGPTWHAVDYAAERVLTHATVGLLLFGIILTLWEISGSVRAVTGAMNQIYDTPEERSMVMRFATSWGLAVAIVVCLVGAILVLTIAKHLGGSLHVLVSAGRWIVAAALLGLAIELLVRFAPAERRPKKWVTLGSAVTLIGWIVASVIFRYWVTSVASFRTPWGTFVAVLVLTAYLYTSSIIFLVGVQADELIRKDASSGERGILDHVRAALG